MHTKKEITKLQYIFLQNSQNQDVLKRNIASEFAMTMAKVSSNHIKKL